jgi:hypothetical protein
LRRPERSKRVALEARGIPGGIRNDEFARYVSSSSGSFTIRNFLSNQALEVSRGSTTAGAALDQWIPVNGTNEYWNLTPAS